MATTIKHLMRPYMNMAQSYATAVSRRSHHTKLIHMSVSHIDLKLRTLTISPKTHLKDAHIRCRSRRMFTTTTRASASHHVNDPGSIDSPLMQSMENKIKDELNAESVIVKDAYGDGRHVSIVVVSAAFEGQSAVNRQRMVYKAIWEELQSTVHAVDQMVTRTPSEVGEAK